MPISWGSGWWAKVGCEWCTWLPVNVQDRKRPARRARALSLSAKAELDFFGRPPGPFRGRGIAAWLIGRGCVAPHGVALVADFPASFTGAPVAV